MASQKSSDGMARSSVLLLLSLSTASSFVVTPTATRARPAVGCTPRSPSQVMVGEKFFKKNPREMKAAAAAEKRAKQPRAKAAKAAGKSGDGGLFSNPFASSKDGAIKSQAKPGSTNQFASLFGGGAAPAPAAPRPRAKPPSAPPFGGFKLPDLPSPSSALCD